MHAWVSVTTPRMAANLLATDIHTCSSTFTTSLRASERLKGVHGHDVSMAHAAKCHCSLRTHHNLTAFSCSSVNDHGLGPSDKCRSWQVPSCITVVCGCGGSYNERSAGTGTATERQVPSKAASTKVETEATDAVSITASTGLHACTNSTCPGRVPACSRACVFLCCVCLCCVCLCCVCLCCVCLCCVFLCLSSERRTSATRAELIPAPSKRHRMASHGMAVP